jgi:hypothetical protein
MQAVLRDERIATTDRSRVRIRIVRCKSSAVEADCYMVEAWTGLHDRKTTADRKLRRGLITVEEREYKTAYMRVY